MWSRAKDAVEEEEGNQKKENDDEERDEDGDESVSHVQRMQRGEKG